MFIRTVCRLAAAIVLGWVVFAPAPAEAAMRLGQDVTPPSGLIDFCRRVPSECNPAGPAYVTHMPAETVALPAPGGATAAIRRDADPIGALMAPRSGRSGRVAPSGRAVLLTGERWRELVVVNRAVNDAIESMTDLEAFGKEEYWTLPLSVEGRPVGDCEDYALEKRRLLLARGWPADTVLLATAMAPGYGRHAVLVVRTDRGDLVLDNLTDDVRHWTQTGYAWQSRQAGADPRYWVAVGR